VVDDEDVDGRFTAFHLQAELIVSCGFEDGISPRNSVLSSCSNLTDSLLGRMVATSKAGVCVAAATRSGSTARMARKTRFVRQSPIMHLIRTGPWIGSHERPVVGQFEKTIPQGLKPSSIFGFCGTTEFVPFHEGLKLTHYRTGAPGGTCFILVISWTTQNQRRLQQRAGIRIGS